MRNSVFLLGGLAVLVVVLTFVVRLINIPSISPPPARSEAALAALGWRLLSEPRLSADGRRSCFTCHRPEQGYTDGRPVATPGGLNTPPLWGLRERQVFGWFSPEMRSLEMMVLRPLSEPAEMGPRTDATLARLRSDPTVLAAYRAAFPNADRLVTWEQTGMALAAAVRAIEPPISAYDRFLAGADGALSEAALRGHALFVEVGCRICHRPPTFASDSFHAIGLPVAPMRNQGRARVPSLRGVRYTAPYFHDGSAATLEAVVRHYARGGGPGASPAITPLNLTDADVHDLVAFLESL